MVPVADPRSRFDRLLGTSVDRVAFVFAHPDDVVLSASIALVAYAGCSVDVVVCAGKPPSGRVGTWDSQSGFHSAFEARETRLAEQTTVRQSVSALACDLDICDGQYESHDAGPDRAFERTGRFSRARVALRSALQAARSRVIITHFGDAHHPDHRLAASLAHGAGRDLGLPVLRACDRPYVECGPECCARSRADAQTLTVELNATQWERKQRLLDAYASQQRPMREAFGDGWARFANLGIECYARDVSASGCRR